MATKTNKLPTKDQFINVLTSEDIIITADELRFFLYIYSSPGGKCSTSALAKKMGYNETQQGFMNLIMGKVGERLVKKYPYKINASSGYKYYHLFFEKVLHPDKNRRFLEWKMRKELQEAIREVFGL